MTSAAFRLFTLALLMPSVVLHELAHGYVSLRHGQLATGLAGPAANLALAVLGGGVAWTAWLLGAADVGAMGWMWIVGAALLPLFLSNRGLYTYYRLQRYAFPMLIALLWGVPALFQVDSIGAYFRHTVDPIFNLLVPRQGPPAGA